MSPQLNCPHRNTDDAISRHPAVRNLVWRNVRSMLHSLDEVAREPKGNLKVKGRETVEINRGLSIGQAVITAADGDNSKLTDGRAIQR